VYRTELKARRARLKKYAEVRLLQKVEVINSAYDWVADWSDSSQAKYYLYELDTVPTPAYRQVGPVLGVMYGCEEAMEHLIKFRAVDLRVAMGIQESIEE
jgi:hypothetical protein